MTTTQKLLPPAPNTQNYPVDGSFGLMREWREGAAAQDALDKNAIAAQNYLYWFNNSWLAQYNQGSILPWDANPQLPPVVQWALITESTLDNGGLGIDYVLVDAPTGARVCEVPAFKRMPPPQTGQSLMQKLVTEGGATANPSIPVVAVNSTSTASDGTKWVRIA